MRHLNRKTTPKVIGGAVLRKNNHKKTPNYWNTAQKEVQIDELKPGKGFKHFLKKRDIIKFISIIPNWNELSNQLNAIVLSPGGFGIDGYYSNDGVIEICAWEKEQNIIINSEYYEAHNDLFRRLKIKASPKKGGYFCEFNKDQIQAYQLLHILLHELGHHYDRINTKSKFESSRGENYAEEFAFKNENQIWKEYQNLFSVVF